MNRNRPGAYNYREYSGFLHILCDQCGQTRTFSAKEPITHYICKECGNMMELGRESMRTAFIKCECGSSAKYKTNIKDQYVEIPCVADEYICTSEYSYKKRVYIPIKGIV